MNKKILNYEIIKPNHKYDHNIFIIFIHGYLFNDIWNRSGLIKHFADYQCVLIDVLGFGNSPKPHDIEYTIEDHILYMENTINKVINKAKSPILYGVAYSTGSIILVNLMAKKSLPWCKSCIISSAFSVKTKIISKELNTFYKLSTSCGFDDFFNMSRFVINMLGDNLSLFNYHLLDSRYIAEFKKNDPYAAKKTFFNLIFCPEWDTDKIFSKINKKILCIHPKHDEFISFDFIQNVCNKFKHIFTLIPWENNHFIDHTNCDFLGISITKFFF
jgi:pimeloyl-ACP methyl ester carboxylesterase